MAEDFLHRKRPDLSSNNLDFDQNVFNVALFEVNKEVESLIDFGFTLLLYFNSNATINAEYIRQKNCNHSGHLQIIQVEYRLNPQKKC